MGIFEQLPDLSALATLRGTAQVQAGSLREVVGGLGDGAPGSPIAAVAAAVAGLGERVDIDVGGLTNGLPAALETIRGALPDSAVAYVESIAEAYAAVEVFLRESPLVEAMAHDQALTDAALAVIRPALDTFEEQLAGLAGSLIGADELEQVRRTFAQIEALRDSFPAHRDELLPFIARNLVGVTPDLLREPLLHLQVTFEMVALVEPEALATTLLPLREALGRAVGELVPAVAALDPADAAGYALLQERLDQVAAAVDELADTLAPLYAQVAGRVESHPWALIFETYRLLMDQISLDAIPSADDVVDQIAAVLDELLARMFLVFGADDLRRRVEGLSGAIRATFAGTGIGQVRQVIADFLEQIHEAIAAVPTGEVQAAAAEMLERVGQELDALGIEQVGEAIARGFAELDTFVTGTINDALSREVGAAMAQVLAQVRDLPVVPLIDGLREAIEQLGALIVELEQALNEQLDALDGLLAELERLSFKPVSDPVIGEIEEIRARLKAINPNALSDAEKLAIKAALAVLEQIELEDMVVRALKEGYDEAELRVLGLLDQLAGALARLRSNLGDFDAQAILGPVTGALRQVAAAAERLNGTALVAPLRRQVAGLVTSLEAISPAALLDPLQAPYDEAMAAVRRLDPAVWTAPLNDLYTMIDRLIAYIDITPVFDELDERRQALLAAVREALLGAFDKLDLPEPLRSFFDSLRPVLDGFTDAIFVDPAGELRRIAVDLQPQLRPSRLFEPLDEVFDRLVALVDTLPQADLVAAVNTIRRDLGVGLAALEPRAIIERFRAAEGRLADLAPATLLGAPLRLRALKLAFEATAAAAPPERQADVAAVSARFEAVITLAAPQGTSSRVAPLAEAHAQLLAALRREVNRLDAGEAAAAYARVRDGLDRLLPDFLRSPQPLSAADIRSGIAAMRPSARAARLDAAMDRFARQVRPLEAALAEAIDSFFGSLRETALLLDPLALKDDVQAIYDELRARVRVLDPAALAEAIREQVFEPLQAPLRAIDPARIKLQVQASFDKALAAVRANVMQVLDAIAKALEEQLTAIRAQLQALLRQLDESITAALAGLGQVIDRVEQLVFVDVIDRLRRVIANLGVSFDRELDRVRNAFDAMLAAIPLGGAGREVSVSV